MRRIDENDYTYQSKITRKDNRDVYHRKKDKHIACNCHNKIRVPKLSASKYVWKNFYKLFPQLLGLDYLTYTAHCVVDGQYVSLGERRIKLRKV